MYSDQIMEEMHKLVKSGKYTTSEICAAVGMSRRTHYAWRKRNGRSMYGRKITEEEFNKKITEIKKEKEARSNSCMTNQSSSKIKTKKTKHTKETLKNPNKKKMKGNGESCNSDLAGAIYESKSILKQV